MSKCQHKDQLVKNIEICMKQQYFKFNKIFYTQTKELHMGSALSLFMAEIYKNNFENTILRNSVYKMKIKKQVRYVADVLIIYERDIDHSSWKN